MRFFLLLLALAVLPLRADTPLITAQPQDQQLAYGENAVMTVAADGPGLTYQWFMGPSGDTTSPVFGARASLLLSLPLVADTRFWVRVTGSGGSTDSAAAAVTVAPKIPATLMGTGYIRDAAVSTPVALADDVIAVVAGRYHALIIKTDGSLWGMGENSQGQLGDGTSTRRVHPVPVAGNVLQMAAGDEHTLFLKSNGSLWATGHNSSGQLGDGSGMDRSLPVLITGNVARVFAGGSKSFFLKTDGSLWGMGSNYLGELGDGTTIPRYSPVKIATGVIEAAAGGRHGLFIKSDATQWAMGPNDHGQLGNGTIHTVEVNPVQVASGVARVAAGPVHSLILKLDGTLMATGNNSAGQLGIGGTTSVSTPQPCATGVRRMSTNQDHCLFLKDDGSLWGMGFNSSGQLGDGTQTTRTLPVPVAGGVSGMAAGGYFSYFLDAKPRITGQQAPVASLTGDALGLHVVVSGPGPFTHQWFVGAAGDTSQPIPGATEPGYPVPPAATGLSHWVRITNSYGSADSAAVIPELAGTQPVVTGQPEPRAVGHGDNAHFTVTASGSGLGYQWYAGSAGDTSAPVAGATGPLLVTPPLFANGSFWVRVTNLSGSGDSLAAAVSVAPPVSGRLMGAGENSWGQLGLPPGSSPGAPVASGVIDMATRFDHGLFLSANGGVFANGRNIRGQLGDGSMTDRLSPVQVTGGPARMATGYSHSLFVKADGSLWATGLADGGQLGDGGGYYSRSTPTLIAGGVAQVDAGEFTSQILRTDGSLWQTRVSTDYEMPDWVLIASDVIRVRGGGDRFFIKSDGSLWGRGNDNYGQVGDGAPLAGSTPVLVATGVTGMAAGQNHSLFIKEDRSLWAAGYNFYGQLGDGTTTNRSTPVQLAADVVDAAAGKYHSLFVKSDGTLWSMGLGSSGQLGNNLNPNRTVPGLAATGVSKVAAGGSHSWWLDARADLAGQPADAVVLGGQSAGLQIQPGGPGPFTYQWFAGEAGDLATPLAGANSPALQTPPLAATSKFWVRVGNFYGSSDSRTVTVTVALPPQITLQPADHAVLVGSHALYSVAATGGALSYQWFRGEPGDVSSPVAGAAGPVLGLPAGTAAPQVWVRVTNLAGFIDSTIATAAAPVLPPGTVSGMGRNSFGLLADGTTLQRRTPVHTVREVVKVAAGSNHSLFLKSDGSLWGSGTSSTGELGTGPANEHLLPIPVMSGVADMSAGTGFSLILKTDATLWATGTNDYGQHGGASGPTRFAPVQVDSGVSRIAADSFHSLVLKADGSLRGSGNNSYGQLGNGTNSNPGQAVDIAAGVVDIAAGHEHSLFLKNDGSLWATGWSGFGTGYSEVPVLVARDVVACAAGWRFSHFIKNDRSLWAVGRNEFGQLGTGNTTLQATPVRIAEGVAAVSCGLDHACIVKLDRTVWTVGRNHQGQLGTGNLTNRNAPVRIAEGVSATAAGSSHSLFVDVKPLVTRQPASASVESGLPASLELEIHSSLPASVQWYRGRSGDTAAPLAGAESAVLMLPWPLTGTYYWARTSNAWGSRDSAAAALTLAGAGSAAYQEWAFAAGLDATNLPPGDDADGDSLANALERAFDTSPVLPSPEGVPAVALAERNGQRYLDLVFRRSNLYSPAIAFQWSGNLQAWTNFSPVFGGGPGSGSFTLLDSNIDGDGSASLVRISRSLHDDETTGYLRLDVTE